MRGPPRSLPRVALLAGLAVAAAVPPVAAQTATSKTGNVGSAVTRNGYPASGGAAALPLLAPSGATPPNGAAGAAPTATTVGGTAAGTISLAGPSGAGSSRNGAAAPAAGGRSPSRGGGANWVLCPPTGSSGLAPLFAGTDLSCAPD